MAYSERSHRTLWHAKAKTERTQVLEPIALIVGGVLVIVSAVIHLHLWSSVDGYRHIATIGPLFLVQGIVGCALGLAVIALRNVLVGLAGCAYTAASIGGLALSVWFGLFGWHERMSAPYAGVALGVEIAGLVVLLWGAASRIAHGAAPSR